MNPEFDRIPTEKKTARFSIGLYTTGPDGNRQLSYGIKYHQIVEPGVPYFLCRDEAMGDVPENRIIFGGNWGNIDAFAIEYSHDRNKGGLLQLKEEIRQKLSGIPDCFCNVGFSMDEDDVISLHIKPLDFGGENADMTIVLGKFSQLFYMTTIEVVSI